MSGGILYFLYSFYIVGRIHKKGFTKREFSVNTSVTKVTFQSVIKLYAQNQFYCSLKGLTQAKIVKKSMILFWRNFCVWLS